MTALAGKSFIGARAKGPVWQTNQLTIFGPGFVAAVQLADEIVAQALLDLGVSRVGREVGVGEAIDVGELGEERRVVPAKHDEALSIATGVRPGETDLAARRGAVRSRGRTRASPESTFGDVTAYQAPRSYELGLRFTW